MLYTALTKKAMRIAYNAHRGQEDEAGLPYIHHPLHLAEQMPDEASITVALLHDVVEKTMMTFADLERVGFPAAILEALRLLTREPAVPYLKYIAALKGHPIARLVKTADLLHDSDPARYPVLTDRIVNRLNTNTLALQLLEDDSDNPPA